MVRVKLDKLIILKNIYKNLFKNFVHNKFFIEGSLKKKKKSISENNNDCII